jgi:hypothetical protein
LVAAVTARCRRCRRWPAITVTFRDVVGLALVFKLNTVKGRYCRDCGLALARRTQTRTLVVGWWGLVAIPANIVVIALNGLQQRKLHALGRPR